MEPLLGDILTVKYELFNVSGNLIFNVNDKVKIDRLIVKEEFFGKKSGVFYPAQIRGIEIDGVYGEWSLEVFKETSKSTKITREVLLEKIVLKKCEIYD